MDRYQKVEKPRAEQPINENEIRITSQGRMRSYITYAMTLLQEKGSSEIVFKAMGRAINKTVTIVELIKRRIVGLHQITSIGSTDITDTWEPLEEGLLPLETTRHVSMITITLSKVELNTSSIGYQPPIPADQVKVSTEFEYEGEGSPTARGRGRGGRGLDPHQEMVMHKMSMMTVVGKAQVVIHGEEVVEGAAASVDVEGEITTMPHIWIISKMLVVTIKNLLGAEVVISVAVEGAVTTMGIIIWITSKMLAVTITSLLGAGAVTSVVVVGAVIITNHIWIMLHKMPEDTIKNIEAVVVGGVVVEGAVAGSDRTGQIRRQKAVIKHKQSSFLGDDDVGLKCFS